MTTKRGELLCAEARKLEVLHNGAALGQVTISVGAACFPDTANNAQALLSAADGALYEAKDSGRDRVVTAKCRNRETQTSASAAAGVAG
jgi:diguanylate cyclase (GGDEF)-like protein